MLWINGFGGSGDLICLCITSELLLLFLVLWLRVVVGFVLCGCFRGKRGTGYAGL